MDQLNTKNKNIVEIFVYISLISLILTRHVLTGLRSSYNLPPSETPERRFTIVFSTIAERILHDLISPYENKKNWIVHEKYLLKEMIGEKRKRQLNLDITRD